MEDSVIQVRGLTRRFGETLAVDALDFEVRRGELFGLVGPDGAGKTTTLRMLAGVLRPSGGNAVLAGIPVVKKPDAVKHALAYMPQRFGLYTDLTVLENIRFYADLYRVTRAEYEERLERLFEFSGLGPFRDRIAGKLSGGMKQKLGLSCALIHQPAILLLDEPTFGVDPISRRDLWIIIHEMVGAGVTAVVSTSYMDEAERFDRLVMLDRGKLVALDTPAALRDAFGGMLLSIRMDRPRRARAVVERLAGVARAVVFGDALHATVSDGAAAEGIAAALRSAGFEVRSIDPIEPALEDVFIDRVGGSEEER